MSSVCLSLCYFFFYAAFSCQLCALSVKCQRGNQIHNSLTTKMEVLVAKGTVLLPRGKSQTINKGKQIPEPTCPCSAVQVSVHNMVQNKYIRHKRRILFLLWVPLLCGCNFKLKHICTLRCCTLVSIEITYKCLPEHGCSFEQAWPFHFESCLIVFQPRVTVPFDWTRD